MPADASADSSSINTNLASLMKGTPLPVKLEGQSFETECDTVLLAIGSRADALPEKTPRNSRPTLRKHPYSGSGDERNLHGPRFRAETLLGPRQSSSQGDGRRAAVGINALLKKMN